jgi:hypothetical protein
VARVLVWRVRDHRRGHAHNPGPELGHHDRAVEGGRTQGLAAVDLACRARAGIGCCVTENRWQGQGLEQGREGARHGRSWSDADDAAVTRASTTEGGASAGRHGRAAGGPSRRAGDRARVPGNEGAGCDGEEDGDWVLLPRLAED